MNERIQEIAKQCWDQRLDGQLHFDTEHFAFLIVRECAELVRKYNYECIRNDVPYGISSDDIMKHFGVEE